MTPEDDFPYEDPPETAPVLPDSSGHDLPITDVAELPIAAGQAVASVRAAMQALMAAIDTVAGVGEFARVSNAFTNAEQVCLAVARALDATTEEGSP